MFVILISGNSKNIIKVMEVVVICDMMIIVFIGKDGGEMVGLFGENDVEIWILLYCIVCIYEVYMVMLYCLCDLID